MEQFLKNNLKQGKEIIFNNERTFIDDFREMTCSFENNNRNQWANGFKIQFNGAFFGFKTFKAFFKKFNQLKNDFDLELKSW